MTNVQFNRRQFLAVSGAVTAGLVVGANTPSAANHDSTILSPGVWLQITREGNVCIWCKRAELGQGTRSSIAMIVADELGAAWDDVEINQVATTSKDYGYIMVGGSGGLSSSWNLFREIAAKCREMLIAAASSQLGFSPEFFYTEASQVVHRPSGRRLPFSMLVDRAAVLPVPSEVTLKESQDYTLVGQDNITRKEQKDIVCGRAIYGIDMRLPEMRHATIVRPPLMGATVSEHTLQAIKRLPGVERAFFMNGKSFPAPAFIRGGVVIVASSTWEALKARESVDFQWQGHDQRVFSSSDIYKDMDKALDGDGKIARGTGNVEKLHATEADVLEAEYRLPFLAHAPIEPMNTVASYHDGKFEIWSPTQSQTPMQRTIASFFGVAEESVVVHCPLIGGGFGRRLEVDYGLEAAIIAHNVPFPVQLLWTREDEMQHSVYRSASKHRMKAFVSGSELLGCSIKVSNLSVWEQQEPDLLIDGLDWSSISPAAAWPYGLRNLEISQHLVNEHAPVGWWRGVYGTNCTVVQECWVDEIAAHMGLDPIGLRLELLEAQTSEVVIQDHPDFGDKSLDTRRLAKLIRFARDRSNWEKRSKSGVTMGFACDSYDTKTNVATVIEVEGGAEMVIINRVDCFVDCGIAVNPDAIKAQFEGGVMWGLSALTSEITFDGGRVEQSNFHDFEVARMAMTPMQTNVYIMESEEQPSGVGEPAVTATMPAIINAISRLTGRRIRNLPIKHLIIKGG